MQRRDFVGVVGTAAGRRYRTTAMKTTSVYGSHQIKVTTAHLDARRGVADVLS
jgi:hypothetical protein